MRKHVKIKAFVILFAWLVIFAHSIYPHNHIQDQPDYCVSLFHYIYGNSHTDSPAEKKFSSASEGEHVCHISNSLFHQFNHDNLIIVSGNDISVTPLIIKGVTCKISSGLFISKPYPGKSLLRAPPLS